MYSAEYYNIFTNDNEKFHYHIKQQRESSIELFHGVSSIIIPFKPAGVSKVRKIIPGF